MAGGSTPAFFSQAVVLLGAAVVAAPLFKRIGLGTVLGYLAAGIIIGPVLKIITDAEGILTVSELGVVFLLFIIGLELKPKKLWALRRDIFGLGFLQVLISGIALMALVIALTELSVGAAIAIGFGLALSSTAFGLQILGERGELNQRHGQKAFAILLFQDLAIVPLLAIVPFLAPVAAEMGGSMMRDALIAFGALALLILAGLYLLNPLFRIIGNTGAREAMIATALLVVLGSAYLMQAAGLSMALGAFIAGVMLAESSYRHELEADIEPFRGLLLGLFFIAIGMSIDLATLREQWLVILLSVPVMMVVKSAIIYGLARIFGNDHGVATKVSLTLPQGGEFGFVIFALAASLNIFDEIVASVLIAIVTLSMALTPLSVALQRFFIPAHTAEEMEEDFEGAGADVMMIGFSRFGQIASQILLAGGSNVTIIDHSADRVRAAGRFGFRIYFGDGTRREVLEAAGIRQAKLVAICTNNREITDKIVSVVQSTCPNAAVYVRAYDREHAIALRKQDVTYELRETLESGLMFGRQMLIELGTSDYDAEQLTKEVRRRDEERLRMQVAQDSLMAGSDMVHTAPAKIEPMPLSKPEHEGTVINEADANVTEEMEN